MKNKSRNDAIVKAVKGGMSYGEAAEKFSVTRNAVAGVCNRAGFKTGGIRDNHREKVAQLGREAIKVINQWRKENPEKSSALARKAVAARWAKYRKTHGPLSA